MGPAVRRAAGLAPGERLAVRGAHGAAGLIFLLELVDETGLPLLILTQNQRQADNLAGWMRGAMALTGREAEVGLITEPPVDHLFDFVPLPPEAAEENRRALTALAEGEPALVFAPATALVRLFPAPGREAEGEWEVRVGMEEWVLPGGEERGGPEGLVGLLAALGYGRSELVVEPGQFARRGGLVDLWSPGAELPLRVEFLDLMVERILTFDPATQRRREELERATLVPVAAMGGVDRQALTEQVRERLEGFLAQGTCPSPSAREELLGLVEEDLALIGAGSDSPRLSLYAELVATSRLTLGELAARRGMVVVMEPELSAGEFSGRMRFIFDRFAEWRRAGLTFLALEDFYLTRFELSEALSQEGLRVVEVAAFPSPREEEGQDLVLLPLEVVPPHRYTIASFTRTLCQGQGAKRAVILTQYAQRVEELLEEAELSEVPVVRGVVPAGFDWPGRLLVISDQELFGEVEEVSPRGPRRSFAAARPLEDLTEIRPGDLVVHVDHGIGRFAGLTERELSGARRTLMEIEYAGGDRLYVSVEHLDRVRRYLGDRARPGLDRLGGKAWERRRRRARREAREVALRLYRLFARRQQERSEALVSVPEWEEEFAEGFPYELTPDQRRAWREIEADLLSERPMDRLLVGDVGFGKTELAMRAAFKVCANGRQVMMIAPTTVLCEQHLHTFRRRFRPFPFRVEMLSRLTPPEDARRILRELAEGKVDILIGTHRALQGGVKFRDLALIIIDEEQRFGVEQKEGLRERYPGVNVLSLSATPIPRTLHLSLSGIRDISVIETPPRERKPVITYVGEYKAELVRDAILKELARGGQVYYLHNRIEDIEQVRGRLSELVPEARIAVAHGRLSPERLEQVMEAFTAGAFDLLLATTIIENGLDLRRVNTLIVDRAERLGLAQMHQLRGRVGRAEVQAYAWFFHSPEATLTQQARQRLEAIYHYAYLGAGLEIALSDLRIRGAGTVFGTRQHGAVEEVGLDYYLDLVAGSINALRSLGVPAEGMDDEALERELERLEERIEPPQATTIDLPIPAFLPSDYIEEQRLRLAILRRIASLKEEGEVEEFGEELADRFGEPPRPVENLLRVVRLRNLATPLGISTIRFDGSRGWLVMSFAKGTGGWWRRAALLDPRFEVEQAGEGTLCLRVGPEEELTAAAEEGLRLLTRLRHTPGVGAG